MVLSRPDPNREAALLIMPFGRRDTAQAGIRAEPQFVAQPLELVHPDVPTPVTLIQGRTMLARTDTMVQPFAHPAPLGPSRGAAATALPPPTDPNDALASTVMNRRSRRRWTGAGMSLIQLSNLLHAAYGHSGGRPDPSVEHNHALRLYVVALNVRGLHAGAYAYDPAGHQLLQVTAGDGVDDLRRVTYEMSLFQKVAGDADAVVVKTAATEVSAYPDGARGYRYSGFDAGLVGARLYLMAEAQGLGATGIGAYFDGEVAELFGLDPAAEQVTYLTAVGAYDRSEQRGRKRRARP
jgi:SagB-type dehydrogenase family enzyme